MGFNRARPLPILSLLVAVLGQKVEYDFGAAYGIGPNAESAVDAVDIGGVDVGGPRRSTLDESTLRTLRRGCELLRMVLVERPGARARPPVNGAVAPARSLRPLRQAPNEV